VLIQKVEFAKKSEPDQNHLHEEERLPEIFSAPQPLGELISEDQEERFQWQRILP